MAAVDPYTSRLEASMRLLTDRLAFMDAQTRQLVAENSALREELDLTSHRVEIEARERAREIVAAVDQREAVHEPATDEAIEGHREQLSERAAALHDQARERIDQVRARGSALATAAGAAAPPTSAVAPVAGLPPPEGEPVAVLPPPVEADRESADLEAERVRAAALQAEINALLELRETVVTSIRATLLDLAERLAAAEGHHAADAIGDG